MRHDNVLELLTMPTAFISETIDSTEAAKILKISTDNLRHRVARGLVPVAFKANRSLMFWKKDIIDLHQMKHSLKGVSRPTGSTKSTSKDVAPPFTTQEAGARRPGRKSMKK
jgi:hypothetical protein